MKVTGDSENAGYAVIKQKRRNQLKPAFSLFTLHYMHSYLLAIVLVVVVEVVVAAMVADLPLD
jgi:hypothetical protein